MASKRRNVQHSCRRRLLGTLGALALAGCAGSGGSGDVGSCCSQIHFTMRNDTVLLTLQWFLADDIADLVNFVARYSSCGQQNACNDNDGIYHATIVRTSTRGADDTEYVGVFTIGLRFSHFACWFENFSSRKLQKTDTRNRRSPPIQT